MGNKAVIGVADRKRTKSDLRRLAKALRLALLASYIRTGIMHK